MKNFTFTFIVIVSSFLWASTVSAQSYKGAVGLRLGSPLSVSGKLFLSESGAVEAFVGTRKYSFYRWVTAGVAYQIHKPLEIENIEGLSYYYGAGVNAYFWSYDEIFDEDDTSTSFGVAGYIGLDYAFENIPLSLTVDWVPTYFINSYISGFGAGYGSLGVRYIFSRG